MEPNGQGSCLHGSDLQRKEKITGFDRLCDRVKYSERQRVAAVDSESWLDGVITQAPLRAHM